MHMNLRFGEIVSLRLCLQAAIAIIWILIGTTLIERNNSTGAETILDKYFNPMILVLTADSRILDCSIMMEVFAIIQVIKF